MKKINLVFGLMMVISMISFAYAELASYREGITNIVDLENEFWQREAQGIESTEDEVVVLNINEGNIVDGHGSKELEKTKLLKDQLIVEDFTTSLTEKVLQDEFDKDYLDSKEEGDVLVYEQVDLDSKEDREKRMIAAETRGNDASVDLRSESLEDDVLHEVGTVSIESGADLRSDSWERIFNSR